MLPQLVSNSFLHVFDVDSGLWTKVTLGSGVSPLTVEAMNAILRKDGILAFIGGRSEFGAYCLNLERDHGTDFRHCWTSLPASTIMSMLGLCHNMPMSGAPEVVLNGSPLTIMLSYLIAMERNDLKEFALMKVREELNRTGLFTIDCSMLEQVGVFEPRYIESLTVDEALSYLED